MLKLPKRPKILKNYEVVKIKKEPNLKNGKIRDFKKKNFKFQ